MTTKKQQMRNCTKKYTKKGLLRIKLTKINNDQRSKSINKKNIKPNKKIKRNKNTRQDTWKHSQSYVFVSKYGCNSAGIVFHKHTYESSDTSIDRDIFYDPYSTSTSCTSTTYTTDDSVCWRSGHNTYTKTTYNDINIALCIQLSKTNNKYRFDCMKVIHLSVNNEEQQNITNYLIKSKDWKGFYIKLSEGLHSIYQLAFQYINMECGKHASLINLCRNRIIWKCNKQKDITNLSDILYQFCVNKYNIIIPKDILSIIMTLSNDMIYINVYGKSSVNWYWRNIMYGYLFKNKLRFYIHKQYNNWMYRRGMFQRRFISKYYGNLKRIDIHYNDMYQNYNELKSHFMLIELRAGQYMKPVNLMYRASRFNGILNKSNLQRFNQQNDKPTHYMQKQLAVKLFLKKQNCI